MKVIIIALTTMLAMVPMARADENKAEPPRKGTIRADELPKPIPELLQKIQQLSRKIEPEISRLGQQAG